MEYRTKGKHKNLEENLLSRSRPGLVMVTFYVLDRINDDLIYTNTKLEIRIRQLDSQRKSFLSSATLVWFSTFPYHFLLLQGGQHGGHNWSLSISI